MKSRKLTYVGAIRLAVAKSPVSLLMAVVTLFAAVALSNPLAAQDKQDHLHRTLGTGNDAVATQSQSYALGGWGSFDVSYWSLLSQVVDDQKGAPSVDPLSLQPPAILNNDNPAANPNGNYHNYKACWKVARPGPLDPPGTSQATPTATPTRRLAACRVPWRAHNSFYGSTSSPPTGTPFASTMQADC
jgi:hypothetical protein